MSVRLEGTPSAARRRLRAAAVAVLAAGSVAIAGCGGDSRPSGAGAGTPATFVPAGTPIYFEANTALDSSQWKQAMALAERFPAYRKLLASARADLGKKRVDFTRDIRPLLGDSIALVVPTIPPSDDVEDSFLYVIDLAAGKDAALITLLKAGGNIRPTGRSHRGAEILKDAGKDGFVFTVSDGALIFSPKEALVTGALDAHAAGGSATMAGSERLRDAMAELPDEVLAQGFVDVGALTKTVAARAGEGVGKQLAAEGFGPDSSLAVSLGAEPEGLRLKAVAANLGGAIGMQEFKPTLIDRVPAGALGYVGWSNLFRAAETQLTAAAAADSDVKSGLAQLRGALTLFGLSVEDIKLLTSGEGALVLTPGGTPGAALALSVPDGAAARTVLDRVRERATTFLGAKAPRFGRVTLAHGATGWEVKGTPGTGAVYGVDGDLVLFGTGTDPVRQVQSPTNRLSDDPAFRRATEQMPAKVAGLVWVNVRRALDVMNAAGALKDAPAEVVPNLRPITNLAAWSTGGDSPTFEVFLTIE